MWYAGSGGMVLSNIGKTVYLGLVLAAVGIALVPLEWTGLGDNTSFSTLVTLLIEVLLRFGAVIVLLAVGSYAAPNFHESFEQTERLSFIYRLKIGLKHNIEFFYNTVRFASQNKPLVYAVSVLLVIGLGLHTQLPGNGQQFSFIYATLLFFQVLIARKTHLLTLGSTPEKQGGSTEDTVRHQEVWNAGTETAHNIQVKFRIYNEEGKPISERKSVDLPPESRSLEPGKAISEEKCQLQYSVGDEVERDAKYHLHILAQTGGGVSLLTASKWKTLS